MKQKVIAFFQNLPAEKHEQFNKAFELYRQSEGVSHPVLRNINAVGFTDQSLNNLLYDLQKLHGITDVEKVSIQSSVLREDDDMPSTDEVVANIRKKLELEKEDFENEKSDLEDENEGLKAGIRDLNTNSKIDAKSIRVEFPFLNDKDCPDELKILVADKIADWNRYCQIHAKGEEATPEELAEAIVCFDNNKKIYDELNAYDTTGLVLGLHPKFKSLALSRDVEQMTADELIKYKGSSAKYFSVNKTALAKAKKDNNETEIAKIENRVAERSEKLFLVNKKLGV